MFVFNKTRDERVDLFNLQRLKEELKNAPFDGSTVSRIKSLSQGIKKLEESICE